MSRIGLTPIPLVKGVEVAIGTAEIEVKGPKGVLNVGFNADQLTLDQDESVLKVGRKSEEKHVRAVHGLIRSLIANAVTGVTEGFVKKLEVHGVGFRADVKGKLLTMHLGFSHTVEYEAPQGIELSTEDSDRGAQAQATIVVQGIDKQQVGQVAADIRFKRRPDPYKGKGVRYLGEVIHIKAGKAAG
ncbi:MAG: 50S ribosomal protein L6 [Candidatus Latescibacteria bacterium]|nr:50S ribosomal protein L6 [Candidatus Latescibacterota bacterium]